MHPSDPENGKKGMGPAPKKSFEQHLPTGRSWFFGIGIDAYQHFSHLNNAVKDVKDLLMLLQDQYGLNPEQVITLFDEAATRDNIIDELDRLVEVVGDDDKLVIYYSGHGHLNTKTSLAYWIPQDARRQRTSGYIPNSTIRDYIKAIHSLHTLLISDSCFSGTLFVRGAARSDAATDDLERLRSRWGIVSGRHDEEVYDGDPGTNSPFAASILKVLRRNRHDKLNVARLADQVVEMTRANYKQLPEGNPLFGVGHDGGQYVFRLVGSEANIWERCLTENSVTAYNTYLDRFPSGPHADEALQHIKELEEEQKWQWAGRIDQIYAYRSFLRSFPGGKHAGDARTRIRQLEDVENREGENQLWNAAGDLDAASAYQNYLARYPNGGYALQARARLKELEELARQAVLEGKIEAAWREAQDSDTEKAYEAFLKAYPDHRYAAAASGRLQSIRSRERQASGKGTEQAAAWKEAPQRQDQSAPEFSWRKYLPYAAGILLLAVLAVRGLPMLTGKSTKNADLILYKDTDTLKGKTYRTIRVEAGGVTWMAQNLDYEVDDSWCYDGKASNCSEFGRLYTWEAAGKACREVGWRLPTDQEWREMARLFGGADDDAPDGGKAAYKALIEASNSGFHALLGGIRDSSGSFSYLGDGGYYWSATEGDADDAWFYYFSRGRGELNRRTYWNISNGLSCRCVQDLFSGPKPENF